jgi:3-oxoacyl-[acyl-carrier-protein] synthase-3
MTIKIEALDYYLPERSVSNAELETIHPTWDVEKVGAKSGVLNRHIAGKTETAFDLSKKAVEKLLDHSSINKEDIHGIIFCTQSPDYIMPSNAFLIHKTFGFGSNVWAFDYNLACSGFVYGLAIARGMIVSGMGSNVLLINADTYSKFINEDDRSTSVLFGDGAAATLLTSAADGEGILDISLASAGQAYDSFYIPAGGCRFPKNEATAKLETDQSGNVKSQENIHMNGFAVWKFISNTVPQQIEEILKRNNLSSDKIDQFVLHQASKLTIDSLVKVLNIDSSKVYLNLHRVGNTVSASIPIALKDAINEGKVKQGDLLLLSGFGVGLSWGSAVIKF